MYFKERTLPQNGRANKTNYLLRNFFIHYLKGKSYLGRRTPNLFIKFGNLEIQDEPGNHGETFRKKISHLYTF